MARVLPAKDASLVVGMIQTDIIQQLHHYSPDGLTETERARARTEATAAVMATGVTSLRQAKGSSNSN